MLFAPSAVVGIAVIAVASLAPVVQFAGWSDTLQNRLVWDEPWLSAIVGIMATAVLIGQRRVLVRLRRVARDRAERDWLRQVAVLLVMVGDLSRTPVQRLREQATRVETDCPDATDVSAGMLRATDQLNQLNEAIARELSDSMTRREELDATTVRSAPQS